MSASSAFRRLLLTVAVLAVFGAGCGGKKTKEEESNVPNAAMADENATGDSDSGAMERVGAGASMKSYGV